MSKRSGQLVEPDCPEHPVTAKVGGKAQPTLREILYFSSKTKTVNLAQQIGIRGKDLGVYLLEDDSGAIVEGIAAGNKSIEDTNREILIKWLQGSGMQPVAWSTLTKAMRKVELFHLAAEVDEAMKAEETKAEQVIAWYQRIPLMPAPSLLPLPPEYVDEVANTVPECATVWCSAKAEYTQYPYGSRQDCWAIVSVKALRITTRHHVDIVAVIDNSGSMAGMKIQLVKETLLRLINLLDERDRIALLTYNTSVKQHFGLQEATAENKQMFRNAISTIIADGRTNLCDGLMKGVEMLAYNGGTKPATVQSVLLLSDGEATEGVTVCEKILKEMNQVKCYSGSVYTFAFGNDCDLGMMQAIASHGKGVCYFIDSLEKIAPSFGHCLGGLKTTVAQNLSLHIEMQEDNRINTVHCHDAIQWLEEDKVCNISIKDIQCGEEKCVALTLILHRLMEERSVTVLKGTLSFLHTGSTENKLQDFQLHLKRADGCCSDISDYQVDQQRNRILAIGAINDFKKSGNICKARNHMFELIKTIEASVSHSSPWTMNMIFDLKECMASFSEPIQDKQRQKHPKSMSLERFTSKISDLSSQHEQTNILLDPMAYDLSEDEKPLQVEPHVVERLSTTRQQSSSVQQNGSVQLDSSVLLSSSAQHSGWVHSQYTNLVHHSLQFAESLDCANFDSEVYYDVQPASKCALLWDSNEESVDGQPSNSVSHSKSDPSLSEGASKYHEVGRKKATSLEMLFDLQNHATTKSSSPDSSDFECSEESNEDQFLQSSGALALNSMLHALIQQRSNRVGACMFRTEAKDEMQRKILE